MYNLDQLYRRYGSRSARKALMLIVLFKTSKFKTSISKGKQAQQSNTTISCVMQGKAH